MSSRLSELPREEPVAPRARRLLPIAVSAAIYAAIGLLLAALCYVAARYYVAAT
jgi:hypothetical protein